MQGRARTKATKQSKVPNKLGNTLNLIMNFLIMTKENFLMIKSQTAFLKIYHLKSTT